MYNTDAGLIIAYSQAHANDRAREVLESSETEEAPVDIQRLLWEIN